MRPVTDISLRASRARHLSAGAQAALLALADGPLASARGPYFLRLAGAAPAGAERFSGARELLRKGLAAAGQRRGPYRSTILRITPTGRFYAATLLAEHAERTVAALLADAEPAP